MADSVLEDIEPLDEETLRAAALTVTDYAAYNLWENGETLEILRALGLDSQE